MRHIGFTTLELLVVVFILAVIAGSVMAIYGPKFLEDQEITATRFKMMELRKALLLYRKDNQSFPPDTARSSPADIAFLMEQGSLPPWDPDYKTGWRGPYLPSAALDFTDIGDDLDFDGSGTPHIIVNEPIDNVQAMADAYTHFAVEAGTPRANRDCEAPNSRECLLEWRYIAGDPATRIDRHGRPYLLFELNDKARARIVSLGPDGIYAGINSADVCEPNGDDHVLCLF